MTKQLLVPFLIVSTFVMKPEKLAEDYYNQSTNVWGIFSFGNILNL